jgi:hypothetical protein
MRSGAWPSVWLLRGVVAVAVLVSLLAGVPEGYQPPALLVVVVAAGAVLAAFRPEHLVLSITLGAVVAWWALQLRGEMPAAALVAAAAIIAAHAAATVLGYGPPALPVDPALGLLWALRAGMSWTAALVVWTVGRAYTGHGFPAVFWLAGLAAAIVGAVVAGVAAPARAEDPRA